MQVAVDDLGNTGGANLTANGQTTITVLPANQRIILNLPGTQQANDYQVTFSSGNLNAISITDVYAENPQVQLTLTAAGAEVQLSRLDGLTIISGGAGMQSTITVAGQLSDVNNALQGLYYFAYSTETSLTISATDTPRDSTAAHTVVGQVLVQQANIFPSPSPTPEPDSNSDEDNTPQGVDPIRPFVPDIRPWRNEVVVIHHDDHFYGMVPGLRDEGTEFHPKRVSRQGFLLMNELNLNWGFALTLDEAAAQRMSRLDEASDERFTTWGNAEIASISLDEGLATQSWSVGAAAFTMMFSAGYLAWTLRAGTLLAAMLSSLPAWQSFDPLTVIEFYDRKRRRDEPEPSDIEHAVEQLVGRSTSAEAT